LLQCLFADNFNFAASNGIFTAQVGFSCSCQQNLQTQKS